MALEQLTWLAGAAGALGVLVLGFCLVRPPRAKSADSARFSAARAHRTVEQLAGAIGLRIPGQQGMAASLEWLQQQFRALPGWEVELQEASAVRDLKKSTVASRHVNLIARLPGVKREAILVNAHVDSTPGGPGAADDASAVAAMLEAARILAAGPRPERSLLFLLNGSEEFGLLGAVSFMEGHPWAKDVAAFINLEAAGSGYPFQLFQAAPDAPALMRAYRRVPQPAGSVLGQDLFESGLLQNDTDYRVFAGAGLRGVDMALSGDGYAYHTQLDRPERLAPGTLQHMGDTLMALLESLLREPDLTNSGKGYVYFDLLNRLFVAYPKRWAPFLLGAAGVLGAVAVWLTADGLPWWMVPAGLLRHSGIALGALLLPIGAAWVCGKLCRSELWWYAHPTAASVAWVLLALAGMAGVGALAPLPAPAAWGGAMALWLLIGAVAVWKRLGSAYLPTAWLLSGALGLLLLPLNAALATFVSAASAMLVTASGAMALLAFASAQIPRNPLPAHLILAGLYGLFTLSTASYVALPLGVGLGALAGAVVALAWSTIRPALTADRPEAVMVLDIYREQGPCRLVRPQYGQLSPALARCLGSDRIALDDHLLNVHFLANKSAVAMPSAGSPPGPGPVITLVSDETREQERHITLRCSSQGYELVLSVAEKVLSMQIEPGDGTALTGARHRLRFTNPPPEGLLVTVVLEAGSPLRLTASSWYLAAVPAGFPESTAIRYHPVVVTEFACS